MHTLFFIVAVVSVPTALFYLFRGVLLRVLEKPLVHGEIVLGTVAISSFGTALARTTGFPDHVNWAQLLSNPVRVELILVGFAFCVMATVAYAGDRRRHAEDVSDEVQSRDRLVCRYVLSYANHFQLYGLGLAMVLIGV